MKGEKVKASTTAFIILALAAGAVGVAVASSGKNGNGKKTKPLNFALRSFPALPPGTSDEEAQLLMGEMPGCDLRALGDSALSLN